MMDTLNSREDVTLGALFLEFGKIGLCGIGSLLVWARRVIVDEQRWMSEAEFAETLSLCQFLPGPEIANVSIYVGSKFRGPIGGDRRPFGPHGSAIGRWSIPPVSAPGCNSEDSRWAIRRRGRAAHRDGHQDADAASSSPSSAVLRRARLRRYHLRQIAVLVVLVGLVPLSIAVAGLMSLRAE